MMSHRLTAWSQDDDGDYTLVLNRYAHDWGGGSVSVSVGGLGMHWTFVKTGKACSGTLVLSVIMPFVEQIRDGKHNRLEVEDT